jgi:4-amino-4-deoxy-L-arabinose transferase-like glycosyltransferase
LIGLLKKKKKKAMTVLHRQNKIFLRNGVSSQIALLGAAVALAALLRLEGLGSASFWQDEALCVINARLPPRQLFAVLAEQNQPPGFHLLLAGWIELFGRSERAVRTLSALMGLAAVGIFGAMAARLFGSRAWLPALSLAGVSSFWVIWSRDGCMYSTTLLLGALIQYLLMQAALAPRRPPWSFWLLLGLLRTALLYTHYFGFFLLVGEGALVAWMAWRRRWPGLIFGWAASVAVTFTLFAPWLPTFLEQRQRVVDNWWSQPLSWKRVVNAFRQWLLWLPEVDHRPWRLLNGVPILCAGVWAVAGLRQLLAGWRGNRPAGPAVSEPGFSWWRQRIAQEAPSRFDALALCCVLGGGQILAALLASMQRSLFEPKYLIAASIPAYMFLLGGLLPREGQRWGRAWAGIFVLFLASQLAALLFARFHPGYRPAEMRSVAEHILREFRAGDIIVVRDNDAASLSTLHCYMNLGVEKRPIFCFNEDNQPPPFWEGLAALPKSAFVPDADLLGAGQKRIWLPLPTPEARPWDGLETGRATLDFWVSRHFQMLGGAPAEPPVGVYDRVNLYRIPVQKEFDYPEMWRRWGAWIQQYRKEQGSSALGGFLRPQ